MRPRLSVSLLGRFTVRAGERILFERAPLKVQELLAYLVIHRDRAHPREALAALLWGESRTGASLKNLRQALWLLRLGLHRADGSSAGSFLRAEARWLQFSGGKRTTVDLSDFERAVAQARGPRRLMPSAAALGRLEAAASLYRGDLLEGWYADWCAPERERLLRLYLSVLEELAEACAASGEYETGIRHAQRALERDPAHEPSHRALMRLFYASGDRSGALRAYERCVVVLRSDLDIDPDERTQLLAREIRGKGGASDRAGVDRPQLGRVPARRSGAKAARPAREPGPRTGH